MTDILLDVDTGVDDALAILFAVRHPSLRLLGVSCVAGNTDVDQVVRNTLKVLDAAGAEEVPVARGATRPLLEPARDATHVHGNDGLADLGLPASTRRPVPEHAIELLRRLILANDTPVTLVSLAPMTNLALLLRAYPEVTANLARIMVMGGSASVGNASAVAEFNVWHDPEAAAVVFGSDAPVTMYGLDVFYGATASAEQTAELAASEDPGAALAGRLLAHAARISGGDHRIGRPGGAHLGDAGAVCAVADPDGLRTERLPLQVELASGLARGQTIVDRRSLRGDAEFHGNELLAERVDVALGIDGDRYGRLFTEVLLGRVRAA
ncbi:MAG TPA: nucleoside hydrolase [Pseudonocardiaceae bacterium]|jgi:pyrimidine-specific ribonucleoside hydrolase|nr:nucleoside hydrolase [Pseudonocardiaceae bacterium]